MINKIIQDMENKMKKSIETFRDEMSKMRTSRAHPSLLEHIPVSYYGSEVPLNQVASITVGDARTLVVTAWDKSATPAIEKAIQQSELGLNPATAGEVIRVPLPPLTEERRRDMTKLVRQEAENARVAVRNIRREANTQAKDLLKAKKISEDEDRRAEENIQKLTDKYVTEIDQLLQQKEKEILAV